MSVVIEACVTTVDEAVMCADSGADRLELCEDLMVDGVSPSLDLVREVVRAVDIPVFAMVRSRPGGFVYTPDEVADMERSVADMCDAGAKGIVVGALTREGDVDTGALARWVGAARQLPVTFHRAIDSARTPIDALESLRAAGVARVLTGGGPGPAASQVSTLAALVRASAPDLRVIAAGGVRGDHVAALVDETGALEVHARAAGIAGLVQALRG